MVIPFTKLLTQKQFLLTSKIDPLVSGVGIVMQWLYSDAIGGVRLYVPKEFESETKAILTLNFSKDADSAFEATPELCAQYDSINLINYTKGKKPAFLLFIQLGFKLFFY